MPSRLEIALDLLHSLNEGALATLSVSMPGYPFASAVSFVTDAQHRPVFLMSKLAEHTQNIAADPRASLLLRRPAATVAGSGMRCAIIGRIHPVDNPGPLVRRYLRYLTEAEQFLQLGDFGFYRLEPEMVRVIGGFGQATWLEGNRLLEAATISLEAEASILEEVRPSVPSTISLVGLDAYGIDYAHQGAMARKTFDSGPATENAAAAMVRRTLARIAG